MGDEMRKDAVFSNAVAKAAEAELLTKEAILRLSAADFGDAVKMLREYGYNDGSTEENFNIDRFIGERVEKLISFIQEYSPTQAIEEFLLAPYLYNNIKAEYKRKCGGNKAKLYNINGAEGVYEGDYSHVDQFASEALNKLDNMKKDPYIIDRELTAAMFKYKLLKAKKSGCSLLIKYVKAEIDSLNRITLLRAEKMGLDPCEFFIEGGDNSFDEEFDTTDIVKLEIQADNYLLKIAESNNNDMDSLGPFFSYVLRQNAELKTVKMILVCIKCGAGKEIQSRIRGLL